MALVPDRVQEVSELSLLLRQPSGPRCQDDGPRPAWDVERLQEEPGEHRHGKLETRGLRLHLATQSLEACQCFIDRLYRAAAKAQ